MVIQPYKDTWLSLVRYVKSVGATALAQNLVPTPISFVNLDAHAHINELPKADFLVISGFSLHTMGQLFAVYCEVGVSTYDDPDNLRHIDLMNLMLMSFLPLTDIDIFSNGNVTQRLTTMTVAGDVIVDPTAKDNVRSLQVGSVKLLPKASVPSAPRR